MGKSVSVITDATSPGFFFTKWHDYYGQLFGTSNLYVLTYQGLGGLFRDSALGGLWETPHRYSDPLRARLIASLVASLLTTHDAVLRCDVDEFLIPDPRHHASLAHYVEQLALPYVTARGVDVVEEFADPALDQSRPLIGDQRGTAIRASSLNKTSITTVPLRWSEGFHGATVTPMLDDLFLFHMKFADIKGRAAWFAHMSTAVEQAGNEARYFSLDQSAMQGLQTWLLRRPRVAPWRGLGDDAFDARFLATVTRSSDGLWCGEFLNGDAVFDIPACFAGVV